MTLLEILIVVTLIIVLVVLLILVFNPQGQINKARDSKRKSELTALSKIFEDWYNDKGCYPRPQEICYDNSGTLICHICGSEPTSPSIAPYISELACDPEQPNKKYTYEVDNLSCPKKYWIYAKLKNETDPIIGQLGCQNGCGPYGDISYNFGVSSPGEQVKAGIGEGTPTPTPTPTGPVANPCSSYDSLYYLTNPDQCDICGSYSNCKNLAPNSEYYIDGGPPNYSTRCTIRCFKD